MFRTLLYKEFLDQRRTHRLLIMAAILLVSGLISPVLAKYTPALIGSIPNLPAGLAAIIPEPTVKDAVEQYAKNASQFGLLLVIILTMGTVAQEKERGTAAMLFTKPIRRSAVILAKWLAGMGSVLIGVVLGGVGFYAYTTVLFEPLPVMGFLALNGLLVVFLGVYLSLALLASSLARTQAMAAAGAFGGLVVLLILSSIPRIDIYAPNYLLSWGQALVLGVALTARRALVVSIGLIILAIATACIYLEREEI